MCMERIAGISPTDVEVQKEDNEGTGPNEHDTTMEWSISICCGLARITVS